MQNFDPNKKCYVAEIEKKREIDTYDVRVDADISNTTRVLAILSLIFGLIGGIPAIPIAIVGLVKDKERKYTVFYIIGLALFHIWIIIIIIMLYNIH